MRAVEAGLPQSGCQLSLPRLKIGDFFYTCLLDFGEWLYGPGKRLDFLKWPSQRAPVTTMTREGQVGKTEGKVVAALHLDTRGRAGVAALLQGLRTGVSFLRRENWVKYMSFKPLRILIPLQNRHPDVRMTLCPLITKHIIVTTQT